MKIWGFEVTEVNLADKFDDWWFAWASSTLSNMLGVSVSILSIFTGNPVLNQPESKWMTYGGFGPTTHMKHLGFFQI